jgi:two-component system osmolarity sensor histidine kinase EnvZ
MLKRGTFSIVRRLTALTVVVGVLALIINGVLISLAVRPLFDDLNESLAGQVAAVRIALQASPASSRPQQARALSSMGLRVHLAVPEPVPSGPGNEQTAQTTDSFLERLRGILGPDVKLGLVYRDTSDAKPQLIARFLVDGEPWAIEFPEPHGSPHEPLWSLLTALLFAALLPLVAMVAGIRFITRPMARLAREVADRSDRLRPLDMSHAVGTELREVFLSFNGLVKAVTTANEARRNMLAGVSHDLRTPLARLRLRAEIECSSDTARALANDCDTLDRIISQFLDYAQGEAGVSIGEPEPLGELIRHIVSLYVDRGLSLEMADTDAAEVMFPDLAIWRIVTNLVDNALAHGRAPVRLIVEVGATECRLSVADAGAGIAVSDAENAFKPFVKLRSRRVAEEELGHCGLGLAIVAQICAELGGRIFHRPFDGNDSAVGVVLPLDQAGDRPSSRVLSEVSAGLAPSQTFSNAL